jgi:hypothetical protein
MLVFGCGDNSEIPAEPDAAAPVCTPPATALPASGPLRALEDYGLPADCVAGGLRDMPGRWFAADLTQAFSFSYPRFRRRLRDGLPQRGGAPRRSRRQRWPRLPDLERWHAVPAAQLLSLRQRP